MAPSMMRKLCPNLDNEDGLETVLEVPIPEEMFRNMGSNACNRWHNLRSLMRAQRAEKSRPNNSAAVSGNDQFMLLLKLIGCALTPFQAQSDHAVTLPIKGGSIEASTAKYIVQQYLAATGGQATLNAITSMYAVGQVNMNISSNMRQDENSIYAKHNCEVGGFVLWQKNPDLWYLELVVSGCKISAGSDGKVSWNQSSSNSNASKGPPRPLRRFFQGLDPRSTANLFLNAVYIGEKMIKNEACFILTLEATQDILEAQSTANTEIVHHQIWGFFSQRTGLLIQLEDSKLVRMKAAKGDDNVFWETNMESVVEDYKYIEGINIAHCGKTQASVYRYGEKVNTRWKIQEHWTIEEVDFNICGLSMDCFLAPSDVKKETDNEHEHENEQHGIR